VNGDVRGSGDVGDITARMRSAEQVIAGAGERFESGDRVITGSVVQVPVKRGDDVAADFGELGRVSLSLT
jgi:2-keto-4-pentenoate hydratase